MGGFEVSVNQYNLVYNALSFSLATMMATTIFCWMRVVRCRNENHTNNKE